MNDRSRITASRRWVVKIGSALLTADGKGLDNAGIDTWVDQLVELRRRGLEVVLVSSGSVAAGMSRLGLRKRPDDLNELQAAAAVGQMGLVQTYEASFQRRGIHTAQILLTHDDLSDRKRYLNARGTLRSLLNWGVVPVINENDTVVTDEIRFGDNDTLAALVANLLVAETLVILTDQQGLYRQDPRHYADAELVQETRANEPGLDAMAGGSAGSLGRGGMLTKIRAARLASRSGACTLVASGREDQILCRLQSGEVLGTLFTPDQEPQLARKRWLAGHLKAKGRLTLDEGAVKVLVESGRSLLPVGVKAVEGDFSRGDMVICLDQKGREIARGLVNYGTADARRIIGKPSREIAGILGFPGEEELVHRDNLVLA